MIKVDNVSRSYGGRLAVASLSFSVRKGSVHGFLGPNGAGKTTTMKMIAALLPPHAGSISLDGVDVSENPIEIRKKIGILLENPPLLLDMEVRDYLLYAARLRGVHKRSAGSYVDEAMEKLGLGHVQNRILGNLSKGYKQKVGVAQAIAHKPEVVILDEPTSGLDPKAVIEMRSLIKSLSDEHTVLFSSHQLKEAELICDDITIIADGRLMVSSSKEEVGKSLANKNICSLLVRRVSEEAMEKLDGLAFTGGAVASPEGDNHRIKVYLNSLEDHREEISELAVAQKMGLLEMEQETPDLEKIFLEVTNTANDRDERKEH